MRKLKRSDCAVLHLGLRRHWYDMIDNGTKCIEFREAKPYWVKRITNWCEKNFRWQNARTGVPVRL